MDGGVLSPLPLDYVERKAEDILVAVDLNAPIPYMPPTSAVPQKGRRETEAQHSKANQRIRALIKKWDEMFGHRSPFRSKEEVEESSEEKIGYFDLIMRSVQLMQHRLTTYALARTPADVLIQISKDCATVFEFYRAKELIEYGREVCAKALDRFENT